jgi:ELWxxDGT repeat protein
MRFFHSIGILLGVMMCCVSASSSPIPLTSFTHDSDQSSNPKDFFEWQGAWYFSAISNTHGRELWTAGLNGENARMLCDIVAGGIDSSPRSFTEHNGELWFVADDRDEQTLLCKINSQGKCTIVKRVEPLSQSNYNKIQIDSLLSTPNHLFFELAYPNNSYREFWVNHPEINEIELVDDFNDDADKKDMNRPIFALGHKILYRKRNNSNGQIQTWIYDPTTKTKQIYDDGALLEHQLSKHNTQGEPLALKLLNSVSVSIVRLPLDGSAPVTLQTYALPTPNTRFDFRLLSRTGNHCLARFSYTGPYPQYQAFAGLARFDLSSNQVELFNIKLDDNDDVGWELFSISPSGEIYCKDYNQAPLMRFGATGPLQAIHTFSDQAIQGIYAAKDDVFVLTEGARSTTIPATKSWQIHQITEPSSNPQATVIQQGTVLADNRFPLSFDANVAASQDGQHIAFSQPIDGYGMEAGFLSVNGAVQSINLNTRGFQTIGSLHTQNDGSIWFSLTKEDDSSQLWQTNTQANDAREPVLEGDVAGSTLDSIHKLNTGLLIFKSHGNFLSCWYRDDKTIRRVSIGSHGWHVTSSYNAKVLFHKNDQALVELNLGASKPGLWVFDLITARMHSLDDHLQLPEGSSMEWSHQTTNFAFFNIEQPTADGQDTITTHWKCDGTLAGTKATPLLSNFMVGCGKWSIYIASGTINANDHLTGKTVALRNSDENIDLSDFVVRECVNHPRRFYFTLARQYNGYNSYALLSDGSAKGTQFMSYARGYVGAKASQRWLTTHSTSYLAFHIVGKEEPNYFNSSAAGHKFLKIHQTLADDLALYFVATTREHGDAIYVSYGTEKTTFLLQTLTTSTPESALLECTAHHLYFHQYDQTGSDQLYALPLIDRRIVAHDFVAHEDGQEIYFTATNEERILQIVRPQADQNQKISWRITGDDAKSFRLGKLLDYPSQTNARYQEIPVRFTSTSFAPSHAQIEFFVDGDNEPFARIPLVASRAIPKSKVTINGIDYEQPYIGGVSFGFYSAWGWNFALQPVKDIRRIIKRVDYFHNGNKVSSGRSLSHLFEPIPDFENNLRAIGYDALGNVVIDESVSITNFARERNLVNHTYTYHETYSFISETEWFAGEIKIQESTDGRFSLEMRHKNGIKRGKGKFDKKGRASVKLFGYGQAISIGLIKYIDEGIPVIDCIVTDGNFNNGIIRGQTYYLLVSAYASNRAETGRYHERPGRYHALLQQDESKLAIAALDLDRDGKLRIKGTWLNGKPFSRVTSIPSYWGQTIYLENQYPSTGVTIRFDISETEDSGNEISSEIVVKPNDSKFLNSQSIRGFADRYDSQQDGIAWRAEKAPSDMQLVLGAYKKSPIQSTLLQRNESSVTWAEYTNGGSTKVKIDTATGSAKVSGKGFKGEALFFRSRGKFFGTATSGKPGQVITVEAP